VVVGDKEIEEGTINVTIRAKSEHDKLKKIQITPEKLKELVREEISSKPYRKLPLAKYLSARPRFF
jgi:threonyl-tRNA synthetase